jgi:hypothetical protein
MAHPSRQRSLCFALPYCFQLFDGFAHPVPVQSRRGLRRIARLHKGCIARDGTECSGGDCGAVLDGHRQTATIAAADKARIARIEG